MFFKRPIVASESSPSIETVPLRKVLYVEIDDEITAIADKLKRIKIKDVYLVVPREAAMLQSSVNLRILRRHAHDYGKSLHLITNDSKGIRLAQQAQIPVYDKAGPEGSPRLVTGLEEPEAMRIMPLKASVNRMDASPPTRLKAPKMSLNEFLEQLRERKISFIKELIGRYRKKMKVVKKEEQKRLVLVVPNRTALVTLITLSLLVVLAISYIALPGATVKITPKATAIEQTVNITLADFEANKAELDTHPLHTIAMHPLETTISRTLNIVPTGKIFEGTNAKGKVTIINQNPQVWPLIPRTRFQTPDGRVYRMYKYVNVPAAKGGSPGMLETEVEADPFDAYGQPIGERGNIGPTRFFLPGLSSENQKRIYAESAAPMTGGTTAVRKKVTREDLDAARGLMKDTLLRSVESELAAMTAKKTGVLTESGTFELLKGKLAYTINEPSISMPAAIEGKELNEFTATGTLLARGAYFNRGELLEILKAELKLKKSPQKRLMLIDDDSVSYRIFDVDHKTKKIKIAATIKGVEEYDIGPDRETGERLIEKVKDHVIGKKLEDAVSYIQNLPEVAKVEIKPWPAWAPTLPNMPDNITVEIASSE